MNRRIAILCLCLVALSLGASATGVLVVDNPSPDFGEVLAGQVVTHNYMLSNTGDATLLITQVQAACGCTFPSWQSATLLPGSSIPLEATFSTAGYSGRVIKTVSVYYHGESETATSTLKLSLSATIVRAEPYDLSVSELERLFILLIDLREADAYAASHFVGALNVPRASLTDWIGVLPRDVFLVVYDQDGGIAPEAARVLALAGYSNAHALLGGLDAWTGAYGSRQLAGGPAPVERFLSGPTSVVSAGSSTPRPVETAYLNQELFVLVDLRRPDAYAEAHLVGALNIQPEDLSGWVEGFPRGTQFVFYDAGGSVARMQAAALQGSGIRTAQALFGGLDEWEARFGDRLLVTAIP